MQFLTLGLPEEAGICSAKTLEFVTKLIDAVRRVGTNLLLKGHNGESPRITQSYVSFSEDVQAGTNGGYGALPSSGVHVYLRNGG